MGTLWVFLFACAASTLLQAQDFRGVAFKGAGESNAIRTRNTYIDCSFTDYRISLERGSEGTRFINCTFSGYAKSCSYVINVNTSDILIDGCKFLDNPGGCPGADFIMVNSDPNGRNSTVRNSLFRNYGADGVQIGHKATNCRGWSILDNEFSGGQENGIDVKASRDSILIRGNIIHGFDGCDPATENCNADNGMGMVIHMGATGVVAERNLVYGCDMGIHVKQDDGPIPYRILLRDNICRNNRREGIRLSAGVDVVVLNNTLVENGVNLHIAAGVTGTNGNNFCVGAGGCSALLGGLGNLGVTTLSGAGFQEPARFDFRLTAGSPAVDRGVVSNGIASIDFYGGQRISGARPDAGADEYQPPTSISMRPGRVAEGPSGKAWRARGVDGRKARRFARAHVGAMARPAGMATTSTENGWEAR